MKERIEQILDEFRLSPSRFADDIGIQRSGMSHILSGRNKPSLEMIQKILSRFPEISPEWLVQGIGKMKKEVVDPNQISIFDLEEVLTGPEKTNKIASKPMVQSNPLEPAPLPHVMAEKEIKEGFSTPKNPPIPEIKSKEPVFSPEFPAMSSEKKKIQRIVIFYTDKTFSEYFPE